MLKLEVCLGTDNNLQKAAFSGMIWKLIEKFSIQVFAFVQGIILARLLSPSDYGLVAMTGIFFALSTLLADAGFSTALIRKKNIAEVDYSTVFVTNTCLSFLFCGMLCICSNLIVDFYNEPLLKAIVCVNALFLFLGSFLSVQNTRMSIYLRFKEQSKINVVISILTGIMAIVMAICGYGVWSLIIPSGIAIPIRALLLWNVQHWWPRIAFSRDSFREFFSFGTKIMMTAIIKAAYNNIYPLIIGKKFTATDLGYYTRANGYSVLPADTVANTLGSISYPILSKIQDDDERLASAYRRMIRLSSYVLFPIMLGMAVLARPMVIVLVTDKWEACIPYLQILCFAVMLNPIHSLNYNLLQTKGRADLRLRVELVQKVMCVIMLFCTVPFGIMAMCIGSVAVAFLSLVVNTYFTGKLIRVGLLKQLTDMFPSFLYSASMAILVWIVIRAIPSLLLQLGLGILVGAVYYILVSKITKSKDLSYLLQLLRENLLKKHG